MELDNSKKKKKKKYHENELDITISHLKFKTNDLMYCTSDISNILNLIFHLHFRTL